MDSDETASRPDPVDELAEQYLPDAGAASTPLSPSTPRDIPSTPRGSSSSSRPLS